MCTLTLAPALAFAFTYTNYTAWKCTTVTLRKSAGMCACSIYSSVLLLMFFVAWWFSLFSPLTSHLTLVGWKPWRPYAMLLPIHLIFSSTWIHRNESVSTFIRHKFFQSVKFFVATAAAFFPLQLHLNFVSVWPMGKWNQSSKCYQFIPHSLLFSLNFTP